MGQKHLMIDLETLDCTPYSAIIQIGACTFDIDSGEILEKFDVFLEEVKGSVDMDTVAWWLDQSKEAQESIVAGVRMGGVSSSEAIRRLTGWFSTVGQGVAGVWSHGSSFDLPILHTAAGRLGKKLPWKYWQERDTRTLYAVLGKPTIEREGVFHSAIDDAVFQAKCVSEVWGRKK